MEYSSRDFDSTSDLLASLDLVDRSKKIELLEVFEVLDSPVKQAKSQTLHCIQDKNMVLDLEESGIYEKEKSAETVNFCQKSSSQFKDSRRKKEEVLREKGSKNCGQCNGVYESGSSVGSLNCQTGFWQKYPLTDRNVKKHREKGKGVDASLDSLDIQPSEGLSRSFLLDRLQRSMLQKHPLHDGCLPDCSTIENKNLTMVDVKDIVKNLNGGTPSFFAHVNGQDGRKGKDVQSLSLSGDGSVEILNLKGRHPKLVHTGCSSPDNIAHGKSNIVTRDCVGDMVLNKLPDGSEAQMIIASRDSEDSWAVRRKGKAELKDYAAQLVQRTNSKTQFGRECLESGKMVTVISANSDTLRSSIDIGRRARNGTKGRASKNLISDSACSSKWVGELCDLSDESPKVVAVDRDVVHVVNDSPDVTSSLNDSKPSSYLVNSELESECGLSNRHQKQVKRKCISVHSSSRECSMLPRDHSEISSIELSRQATNSEFHKFRSSEWNSSVLGPSILVDEENSQVANCSSSHEEDFREEINQVEMDEILAHQLQEEFYYELPTYRGIEEVDETIAWSLQQEEDAQLMASIARQRHYHSRDASMAHLYVHGRRAPFHNTTYQQPTNPARVRSANQVHQQRRNSNSSALNVEMRLSFLEALESAFESSDNIAASNNFLPTSRDFTEDDYEMLLALDESNFEHAGASRNQINSLPLSVTQSGNEETCAVCLELPSTGEIIRHLPCLHKFHKECIDTWLRRRAACPICKSGIS